MDWGPFPDTILRFCSVPPLIVDLRSEVSDSSRVGFRKLGFERTFGVVSAHDPMGLRQQAAVNTGLGASLQADVAELSAAQSPVDACSPDGSHREASIAIALDLQPLIDLAKRYDQLAIFWFDGDAFWIVPARSTDWKLRLPVQT